jgi:hypothetical protein
MRNRLYRILDRLTRAAPRIVAWLAFGVVAIVALVVLWLVALVIAAIGAA